MRLAVGYPSSCCALQHPDAHPGAHPGAASITAGREAHSRSFPRQCLWVLGQGWIQQSLAQQSLNWAADHSLQESHRTGMVMMLLVIDPAVTYFITLLQRSKASKMAFWSAVFHCGHSLTPFYLQFRKRKWIKYDSLEHLGFIHQILLIAHPHILAMTIPTSSTSSTKLAQRWRGRGRWTHRVCSTLPGDRHAPQGVWGWRSWAIRGALPPRSPSPRGATTAGGPWATGSSRDKHDARGCYKPRTLCFFSPLPFSGQRSRLQKDKSTPAS